MNTNQDWQVSVNFSSANTPVEARQDQPAMGFYRVRCSEANYFPPTDGKKPAIRLRLSIIESAHDSGEMGNTMTNWVNLPNESQTESARAWTERFLKATLIGLGHSRDEVTGANGDVPLNAGAFMAREGYIHYEGYNPHDKSTRANISWISGDQYERGIKGEFKVPLKNAQVSSIDAAPAAISATAGFSTATPMATVPTFGAPPSNNVVNAIDSLLSGV